MKCMAFPSCKKIWWCTQIGIFLRIRNFAKNIIREIERGTKISFFDPSVASDDFFDCLSFSHVEITRAPFSQIFSLHVFSYFLFTKYYEINNMGVCRGLLTNYLSRYITAFLENSSHFIVFYTISSTIIVTMAARLEVLIEVAELYSGLGFVLGTR